MPKHFIRRELPSYLSDAIADYLANGGAVTQCPSRYRPPVTVSAAARATVAAFKRG